MTWEFFFCDGTKVKSRRPGWALTAGAKKASARARAVRMISAAATTEAALERKLVQKGEDAADARQAVQWLKDLNLLDDAQVARQLAEAAARAKKAADDAAAGVAVPETFKDYLDKWVYSVKDHDELLDKIGGARLMRLKNEPHLGYSTRH